MEGQDESEVLEEEQEGHEELQSWQMKSLPASTTTSHTEPQFTQCK